MENRIKEIGKAFETYLDVLRKERIEEYSYDTPPDWNKQNACLNLITIRLSNKCVTIYSSCLNCRYDIEREEYDFDTIWECNSDEELNRLTDKLTDVIEKLAANDTEHLFAPAIYLEVYICNTLKVATAVAKNKGYEEYLQSLRDFYADTINGKKEFGEIKYLHFDSNLWGLIRFIDEFGYEELKQLVDTIDDMCHLKVGGESIRLLIRLALSRLCREIGNKHDKLNEQQQDLFNYAGDYMLSEGEKHYAKELYAASAKAGNEVALEKLGRKKKSAQKEKTNDDTQQLIEGVLRQYIAVTEDQSSIEDICTDNLPDSEYRSQDQKIALAAIQYPDLHSLMREMVETTITAVRSRGNLWEDDQEQVAGAIAAELALHNKQDIELYARYVCSNDMDHPVYQYEDMDKIVDKWGVGRDTYPIMAVNGLLNQGQHGGEFIDNYEDRLKEKFKYEGEADAFIAVCAKGLIEKWEKWYEIEHRLEDTDPLFHRLFGTPYFEYFYEEHDTWEENEEYSASARGFIAAAMKGEYPTFEYLMSLEEEYEFPDIIKGQMPDTDCCEETEEGEETEKTEAILFAQSINDDIVAKAGLERKEEYEEYDEENEDEDEFEYDEFDDVTAWVSVEILKEGEKAYKDAIGFLTEIINSGFPVRCHFSCESEVTNYAELLCRHSGKPDKRDSKNQFWANAAQYPALHEDIRNYIKLATNKVEYIRGDELEEDESWGRPDFYAMTALVMIDPTANDFTDLIYMYAGSTDVEYAEDIYHVGYSYMKKYGVTKENIPHLARLFQKGVQVFVDSYIDSKDIEEIEAYMEENDIN